MPEQEPESMRELALRSCKALNEKISKELEEWGFRCLADIARENGIEQIAARQQAVALVCSGGNIFEEKSIGKVVLVSSRAEALELLMNGSFHKIYFRIEDISHFALTPNRKVKKSSAPKLKPNFVEQVSQGVMDEITHVIRTKIQTKNQTAKKTFLKANGTVNLTQLQTEIHYLLDNEKGLSKSNILRALRTLNSDGELLRLLNPSKK